MHRRTFIKLSSFTTAISLTPWLAACTTDPKEVLVTPLTLGAFCSHEDLLALGKSYCRRHADECDPDTLEELILKSADGKSFSATAASALEDFLREKFTADFRANDTAMVDGWILSRTEARQVALYALRS